MSKRTDTPKHGDLGLATRYIDTLNKLLGYQVKIMAWQRFPEAAILQEDNGQLWYVDLYREGYIRKIKPEPLEAP